MESDRASADPARGLQSPPVRWGEHLVLLPVVRPGPVLDRGLRTDSLYLFNWTFLGQPIRVSQALSLLLAVTAAVMLFYNIKIKKHSRDELLVNQVAAEAAEGQQRRIFPRRKRERVSLPDRRSRSSQPPETQNGEGGETDGNTH